MPAQALRVIVYNGDPGVINVYSLACPTVFNMSHVLVNTQCAICFAHGLRRTVPSLTSGFTNAAVASGFTFSGLPRVSS